MPVRNEASRYLHAALLWAAQFADGIHVANDHSNDDSADIAHAVGATVSDTRTTFMDHEGQFRQEAWEAFERTMNPTPVDWVVVCDADEFLVGTNGTYDRLHHEISVANDLDADALLTKIPEVWSTDLDTTGHMVAPKIRTDGYWDKINGHRVIRYRPHGVFAQKEMGCGSEPGYARRGKIHQAAGLWLLHFGYATDEDVLEKYRRYMTVGKGHSSKHVASIISKPRLADWDGPVPEVWRGPRNR